MESQIRTVQGVPISIGKVPSHHLLVLEHKIVVFDPRQDSYFIVMDEVYDQLVGLLELHRDDKIGLLKELRSNFRIFESITGLTLSFGRPAECKGTELLTFEDRFMTQIDDGNLVHGKMFSTRLFLLACAGLCWGSILLYCNRFYVVIRRGRVGNDEKIATSKFTHTVGYNILLASRIMPFAINCKTLAFTYKYVFGIAGYKCDIAIGILEEPFVAHMWAMIGNMTLGEVPEVEDDFQLIYHSSWSK